MKSPEDLYTWITRLKGDEFKDHKLLMGVDPGHTTGVSVFSVHKGMLRLVMSSEVLWESRFTLADLARELPWGVVVCESFRVYAHAASSLIGSDMPSSQVIGMLEYALTLAQNSHVLFYQPASMISNCEISQLHLRHVAGSEHRKDSYKHVITWFVRMRNKRDQAQTTKNKNVRTTKTPTRGGRLSSQ